MGNTNYAYTQLNSLSTEFTGNENPPYLSPSMVQTIENAYQITGILCPCDSGVGLCPCTTAQFAIVNLSTVSFIDINGTPIPTSIIPIVKENEFFIHKLNMTEFDNYNILVDGEYLLRIRKAGYPDLVLKFKQDEEGDTFKIKPS